MSIHLRTVPAFDRQTDRRTDGRTDRTISRSACLGMLTQDGKRTGAAWHFPRTQTLANKRSRLTTMTSSFIRFSDSGVDHAVGGTGIGSGGMQGI